MKSLIEKSEQPKGDFGANATFYVITGYVGIFLSGNLIKGFVSTPHFKKGFPIDKEISF